MSASPESEFDKKAKANNRFVRLAAVQRISTLTIDSRAQITQHRYNLT